MLYHDDSKLSVSLLMYKGDNKDDINDISLTKEECEFIKSEVSHYETLQALVIEALKLVQKRRGWVMDCDIISIAKILRISVSDVEGVATFYSQIFRQPVGRHIIRLCDSVVCYITGCLNVQLAFENFLNISKGRTTLDSRFTFLPVSCLGKCDYAPVVMIDEDVHVRVMSKNIEKILEQYL